MLRVSIHAGLLRDINRFNRVDWLDIGYEKLDAAANYKIVLFNVGEGATPVIPLLNYPRWSASLWDLTARAIALALSPDPNNRKEQVEPLEPRGKRYAYAREVSAVIQHLPNTGLRIRNVGSMQIQQCSVTKGSTRLMPLRRNTWICRRALLQSRTSSSSWKKPYERNRTEA
jgi:hypothetical protein